MLTLIVLTQMLVARAAPITPTTPTPVTVTGDFRLRQEYSNHTDFVAERAATLLRLRPLITWTPAPELSLTLQPQAAKAFGAPEFVATSTTANRAADSSGALNSDLAPVTFHQALASWRPYELVEVVMGRQILSYGDELILGATDWANLARSFDALKVRVTHGRGRADVFAAKLRDTNVGGPGHGDKDFYGLYGAFELGPWVDEADLYAFDVHDATGEAHPGTLIAMGLRLKTKARGFDARLEATREDGVATPAGAQINFEVGYTAAESKFKPRFALEYFYATADFNQLHPTAHRYLGMGDEIGRRNVDGFGAHLSGVVGERFTVRVDYYRFARVQTDRPAYKKLDTNQALGTGAGGAAHVGDEIDAWVKWRLDHGLAWTFGYSKFFAGDYLRDANLGRDPDFGYAQFEATF